MKSSRMTLFLLTTNMFISLLGVGIVIPVMPEYLKLFQAGGTVAGYLVASFGLAQFLTSPLGGKWADQYGRKWLIVTGIALNGVSHLIFAVSEEVWLLFLSRMIGGVGVGFIIPAVLACVSDITETEGRGQGMGVVGAGIGLGMAIGPGIGGMLAEVDIRAPFYTATIVAGVAAVVTALLLPETFTKEKRTVLKQNATSPFKQVGQSIRGEFAIPLLMLFIISFGLMSYETVFPLFAEGRYGFSTTVIAILFTAGALIGAVAQAWLIGILLRRMSEIVLIRLMLLVGTGASLLLLLWGNFWYIFVFSTLVFLASSIVRPAASTWLSKSAGEGEQGYVSGLNSSYSSIGSMVGPFLAGMLYDIKMEFPFFLTGIVFFTGVWLSKRPSAIQSDEMKNSAGVADGGM